MGGFYRRSKTSHGSQSNNCSQGNASLAHSHHRCSSCGSSGGGRSGNGCAWACDRACSISTSRCSRAGCWGSRRTSGGWDGGALDEHGQWSDLGLTFLDLSGCASSGGGSLCDCAGGSSTCGLEGTSGPSAETCLDGNVLRDLHKLCKIGLLSSKDGQDGLLGSRGQGFAAGLVDN